MLMRRGGDWIVTGQYVTGSMTSSEVTVSRSTWLNNELTNEKKDFLLHDFFGERGRGIYKPGKKWHCNRVSIVSPRWCEVRSSCVSGS